MKKIYDRIKLMLSTLWIAIISFSSKVTQAAPEGYVFDTDFSFETMYGTAYTVEQPDPSMPMTIVIKIIQILMMTIIPIIGIVNLIKIRKIDDKPLKNKKIKRTIIILSILVLILIAAFIIPALLFK